MKSFREVWKKGTAMTNRIKLVLPSILNASRNSANFSAVRKEQLDNALLKL